MKSLTIRPVVEGKGRSFQAEGLAWVKSSRLNPHNSEDIRPIWLMYGATEESSRAFTANLRLGRCAEFDDGKKGIVLLKSSKYVFRHQRCSAGVITTAFIPQFFQLDPGMVDPLLISFCILPTAAWLEKRRSYFTPDLYAYAEFVLSLYRSENSEVRDKVVHLSPLLAAYLDRRTRCPLVADPKFHIQLLAACASANLLSFSRDNYLSEYEEAGTESVGLLPGLAFHSTHLVFEKLLAEQTQLYYEIQRGLGLAKTG